MVALLCREHGKLRGLAKGSKRASPGSAARFCGGIELLDRGEVQASTRRGQGLATLTEWDLQETLPGLRRGWRHQHAALYAAELTDAALPEEDPHPEVFDALLAVLRRLDAAVEAGGAEPDRVRALAGYQWNLLSAAGYRPELDVDVANGGTLPDAGALGFDPGRGGLTARESTTAWGVREQTVAALRALGEASSTGDADAAARYADGLPPDTADRVNRLLGSYWRHLLEREPASYAGAIERG